MAEHSIEREETARTWRKRYYAEVARAEAAEKGRDSYRAEVERMRAIRDQFGEPCELADRLEAAESSLARAEEVAKALLDLRVGTTKAGRGYLPDTPESRLRLDALQAALSPQPVPDTKETRDG